jgi:hypothetical protein
METRLCCMRTESLAASCPARRDIAGRKYSDITVITCRNCHRKLSDMQKDHPT